MSNLRIVKENVALKSVLSASSTAGSLEINNVKTHGKSIVYRSVGHSVSITALIPEGNVSCVALPFSNLTSLATMRVKCYSENIATTPIFDTGTKYCCEYVATDKQDYENRTSNTFAYAGGSYASLFFDETLCRKVEIIISDSNNTNGYVDLSYLVIGKYWSPVVNADYGATVLWTDSSVRSRNGAGDSMTERGYVNKKIKFSFSALQHQDRRELTEIALQCGTTTPIYMSLFPESLNPQEEAMYQIYGQFSNHFSETRWAHQLSKSQLEIEEL